MIFLDGVFDFSVVFSIGSEPLHQMANAHGTATEPVDGDEDNAPDASGKGISRKDPVQLTDPMMLLLATTIFDQYGKKCEVLAVTTRQIRYMKCSS